MTKQELFNKAVEAMDNYIKAIEMQEDDFANYYFNRMRELSREITERGLTNEFQEYATVI